MNIDKLDSSNFVPPDVGGLTRDEIFRLLGELVSIVGQAERELQAEIQKEQAIEQLLASSNLSPEEKKELKKQLEATENQQRVLEKSLDLIGHIAEGLKTSGTVDLSTIQTFTQFTSDQLHRVESQQSQLDCITKSLQKNLSS